MGYSPWSCKESDTTERLTVSLRPSMEDQRKLIKQITKAILDAVL